MIQHQIGNMTLIAAWLCIRLGNMGQPRLNVRAPFQRWSLRRHSHYGTGYIQTIPDRICHLCGVTGKGLLPPISLAVIGRVLEFK
jgi:hypothetical protein